MFYGLFLCNIKSPLFLLSRDEYLNNISSKTLWNLSEALVLNRLVQMRYCVYDAIVIH